MDLKDFQALLALHPEFASKVQRTIDNVRCGRIPDLTGRLGRREETLFDMRTRLSRLRVAREEVIGRYDAQIREQEEAIVRMERNGDESVRTVDQPPDASAPADHPGAEGAERSTRRGHGGAARSRGAKNATKNQPKNGTNGEEQGGER